MSNGLVVYDGPSALTRQPIVGILTGIRRPSRNAKTGPMSQLWILDRTHNPVAAVENGADRNVCGNCPLRGNGCYVNKGQAPSRIWDAWQRGNYPAYRPAEHDALIRQRPLRLGAYGEPTALPYRLCASLCNIAGSWSGYTHQWRQKRFRRFQRLCMASVETRAELELAQTMGWRTFRATPDGAALAPTEIWCPYVLSGRKCADCKACAGGNPPRMSVAVPAHGSAAVLQGILPLLSA